MLKTLSPLLGPDLLHVLASMGHGDEIVIADANFPAATLARRLVRLDGASASAALEAITSLVPLDQYVDAPALVMAVVGEHDATPPTYGDFQQVLEAAEGRSVSLARLERAAFYERARGAFAVVATSDTRLYANIIIVKGVVTPQKER
jgi:L-fucose mutarotase